MGRQSHAEVASHPRRLYLVDYPAVSLHHVPDSLHFASERHSTEQLIACSAGVQAAPKVSA